MRFPAKLGRMLRVFAGYRRRSELAGAPPLRLWIETAACCNLRCVMCPNKDLAASAKGLMRLDLFRKVIDECRSFVHDVYLHHRGEPLMNPALFDMIRYARAAGLKTRLHTNGTLLSDEKARQLLAAAPSLVSFSFDGFTKAEYERVRGGAVFERTLENILRLANLRRADKYRLPYIVVEKIRFKNQGSAAEPPAAAEVRRRLLAAGVDEIIEKEEYVWAEASAPERADARTLSACTFPWYAMVICWDGAVTPCPQDFRAAMNLGNAATASLAEIWNGAAYRRLRRQFADDIEALTLCRKCDRLYRKTVCGVPFQYMITFLADQLVGYSRWRRRLGAHERNRIIDKR